MYVYQFHLGLLFRIQEIATQLRFYSNFHSSLAIRNLISLFLYITCKHTTNIHFSYVYLSVCLVFRSVCLIELRTTHNLVCITFLPVIVINIIFIMYICIIYKIHVQFHCGVNVWVIKSQWYFFPTFFLQCLISNTLKGDTYTSLFGWCFVPKWMHFDSIRIA